MNLQVRKKMLCSAGLVKIIKLLKIYNIKLLKIYNIKLLKIYNIKLLKIYNIKLLKMYNKYYFIIKDLHDL